MSGFYASLVNTDSYDKIMQKLEPRLTDSKRMNRDGFPGLKDMYFFSKYIFFPYEGVLLSFDENGFTGKVENFPKDIVLMVQVEYGYFYIVNSTGHLLLLSWENDDDQIMTNELSWAKGVKFNQLLDAGGGIFLAVTPDNSIYWFEMYKLKHNLSLPKSTGRVLAVELRRMIIFENGWVIGNDGKQYDIVNVGKNPIHLKIGVHYNEKVTSENPTVITDLKDRDKRYVPEPIIAIDSDYEGNCYWITSNFVGISKPYGGDHYEILMNNKNFIKVHFDYIDKIESLILVDRNDEFFIYNIEQQTLKSMV